MSEMSLVYINKLLSQVPDGTRIDIHYNEDIQELIGDTEHELIARGMPGRDRRFLNITTGSGGSLPISNFGISKVVIHQIIIEVID